MNGSVNPKGAETKYYFEYGTTLSYGSKTAEVSAGSGISPLEENKAITGLTASTTYDFRLVATNTHGTSYGSNQVFSTTGKPSVETKPATSVNEKEATLNGVVNPRGAETKYYFEYGTEKEKYTSKTAEVSAGSGTSNVEESATITGLTAGTEYYFRIVATNSKGTSDGGGLTLIATIKLTEYTVPEKGEPRDITTGPDGNLWFTNYYNHKIGKITTSGTITEYKLPNESYPEGITAGPEKENALWFTERRTSKIGMITTSGTITEYALPEKREPRGITVGPEGNLWFTEYDAGNKPGEIGKITTSGTITEYELPKGTDPAGIVAGPENEKALWFTEFGSSQIGKITTSGTITQYGAGGHPETIIVGPDGNLWFTDAGPIDTGVEPKIVKMSTSGTKTEYSLPAGSNLDGIGSLAAGPEKENALWFTSDAEKGEENSNRIGSITTSGTTTEYSISLDNPWGITVGPDGKLWLTGRLSSKIATVTAP